jgi:endonuclease/exonuclease/phosphatase family metal-dependent hydrolase
MAWSCQRRNTGFAVTRVLTVVRQPDFEALDIRGDGRLRDGARIDLTHNGQTVQLMSVHLKRGCFENRSTSSACETLLAQVPVLEGWIDAAAEGSTPLIILGDFNRRLTQPGDRVWADLDDGDPPNASRLNMSLMPGGCSRLYPVVTRAHQQTRGRGEMLPRWGCSVVAWRR